jgi:hypothetical protein
MRNVLGKRCRKNKKTHFMFSNFFSLQKSHRLSDNVEKCGRDRGATNDVTIWRIRVACWISKATCTARMRMHTPTRPDSLMHALARMHTHRPISDTYCFTTATMIRERATILRYTYIAPPVYNRNGVLLLRGTNQTFKYFRLLLFTKGRNISAIVSLLIRT